VFQQPVSSSSTPGRHEQEEEEEAAAEEGQASDAPAQQQQQQQQQLEGFVGQEAGAQLPLASGLSLLKQRDVSWAEINANNSSNVALPLTSPWLLQCPAQAAQEAVEAAEVSSTVSNTATQVTITPTPSLPPPPPGVKPESVQELALQLGRLWVSGPSGVGLASNVWGPTLPPGVNPLDPSKRRRRRTRRGRRGQGRRKRAAEARIGAGLELALMQREGTGDEAEEDDGDWDDDHSLGGDEEGVYGPRGGVGMGGYYMAPGGMHGHGQAAHAHAHHHAPAGPPPPRGLALHEQQLALLSAAPTHLQHAHAMAASSATPADSPASTHMGGMAGVRGHPALHMHLPASHAHGAGLAVHHPALPPRSKAAYPVAMSVGGMALPLGVSHGGMPGRGQGPVTGAGGPMSGWASAHPHHHHHHHHPPAPHAGMTGPMGRF
jgi:hypothetical protein